MRAIEVAEFGSEHLRCVERERPRPKRGEALVRVRACALNFRDLLVVDGRYDPRFVRPFVPVSDGCGVVEELGGSVESISVGDRVLGSFAPRWLGGTPERSSMRATLGAPLPGMLTEYVVLPETALVPVPEHLTDEEAATLPCAALTAWSALTVHDSVRAGMTIVVQGSGGVSSFALDFARVLGARVIATTRSADKVDLLRARGAWEVVDTSKHPAWADVARKLTKGRGVDHVVEVIGGPNLVQSLRAVRPAGVVSLVGVLAGTRSEVDLTAILMNQIRVQGVLVGSTEALRSMLRAVAQHELHPAIDRVFAFEEARAAFDYLRSGAQVGKVCIRIASS